MPWRARSASRVASSWASSLPAHRPAAQEQHVHLGLGEVEGGVHRPHRLGGVRAGHHAADAPRARALRDGPHVDAHVAQRAEEASGHVGPLAHRLGHQRHQRDGSQRRRKLHLAPGELLGQGGREHRARPVRGRPVHHRRQALAVARLGDHPHPDLRLLERLEGTHRDGRHGRRPARLHRQQGQILEARHAGRAVGIRIAVRVDDRALAGVHRAADPQPGPALLERKHRPAVKHPQPEVGELPGLVPGEAGDGIGLLDQVRVGGHHPTDVGPDGHLGGAEQRGERGGGVVRAVPAERGGRPVLGPADEAGDDRDLGLPLRASLQHRAEARAEVHAGIPVPVVGAEDLPGVHRQPGQSAGAEGGRDQLRGEALAHREEHVERGRHQRSRLAELRHRTGAVGEDLRPGSL